MNYLKRERIKQRKQRSESQFYGAKEEEESQEGDEECVSEGAEKVCSSNKLWTNFSIPQ